jgi:dipeptidyl aminopeptidase/acylaminoacyl peptidase
MRNAALWALLLGFVSVSAWAAKAPFTFDAMMRLARIDDPQLSPDGNLVAFTVQTMDLANNTKPTHIYVVPVAGGAAVRITSNDVCLFADTAREQSGLFEQRRTNLAIIESCEDAPRRRLHVIPRSARWRQNVPHSFNAVDQDCSSL